MPVSASLSGLKVAVVGDARALHAAARWYADLGAEVVLRRATPPAAQERAWLGEYGDGGELVHADLRIVEHGADDSGVTAPVTVRFAGTGPTAPEPRAVLDERRLAGASGVAVAIGEPDRPPLPLPEGGLDHMVGSHVAGAGIAALLRGETEVEVAAVDVIAWSAVTNANLYLPYGAPWRRAGRRASGSGGCYPYSLFDVADGQYCLIGRTRRDWETFVTAMGSPEWAADPRYHDLRAMAKDYPQEVDDRMAPWLMSHTRADLTRTASELGFPGGPVLTPGEVLALPSLADRWRESAVDGTTVRTLREPFDVVEVGGAADDKPLRDVVVLDLSWVWSGPAVSVGLVDLGATVIKVESATRPDNTRLRGRPAGVVLPDDAPRLEVTPYFHACNRGKRSIALDLRTDEGRAELAKLAARADVIIENLSPGVMDRFGIAPQVVHEANPGCVYVSMRGYRAHPTTAGLRAYAPVLTAGAGVESLVRYPGESSIGMMTYGFSDANAASQGLLLVLAGLWARRSRGVGSHTVLSQHESAILANGRNIVEAQLGEPSDGLTPLGDDEPAVEMPDLRHSPWTSADLLTEVKSPWLGDVTVSRLPWRLGGAFPEVKAPGPTLGQHTEEILTGRLGATASRVAELREAGVLT